jgi:hypothetical protein
VPAHADDRSSPLVKPVEPVTGVNDAARATFLGTDRAVLRRLLQPISDFLDSPTSGMREGIGCRSAPWAVASPARRVEGFDRMSVA